MSALALEDYLLYHMDYRKHLPPTVGERRYPNMMPRVAQARACPLSVSLSRG